MIEEYTKYPNTLLESDKEWEQWANENGSKENMKKKRKSKFYGDLEKEPYIWLF